MSNILSYTTLYFSTAYNNGSNITLFNSAFTSSDGGLTYIGSPTSITDELSYNQNLIGIKIGNIVTSIADAAFKNCTNLSTVIFESGCQLQTLGQFIFEENSSLLSFNIPASVNSISTNMFSKCYNLSSINVDPASATYSSNNGILFTKNGETLLLFPYTLTSYNVPNTIISIGQEAFYNRINLTTITFQQNSQLEIIDIIAFKECTNLTSVIEIPSSVKDIYSSFNNCPNLASVTFQSPSQITTIRAGTFYNCGLTSIIIPSSVQIIEYFAFGNCASLASVRFDGDIPIIQSSNFSSNFTPNFTSNTNDTAYYYAGVQNINRLTQTPQIFTNIVEMLTLTSHPPPIINSVSTSKQSAIIYFTQGVSSNLLPISIFEYSINNGSTWFPVETATQTYLTVSTLTPGTTYNFIIRNYNGSYSLASNTFSATTLFSISQLKAQNAIKAMYISNGYVLSDLKNSSLFRLQDYKTIGYTLTELITQFTLDEIIKTWIYSGAELKQSGLIAGGIRFDILVSFFNNSQGIVETTRYYYLTNINTEVTSIYYILITDKIVTETITTAKDI
jgi:hypothetical protein